MAYSPRSNPFFNAYNFAHYEREESARKLKADEEKASSAAAATSSSGYQLISTAMKLPTIGSKRNTKDANATNTLSTSVAKEDSSFISTSILNPTVEESKVMATTQASSSSTSAGDTDTKSSTEMGSSTGAPPSADADDNDDWEKQMKILEEVDILTAKGNAFIPEPLKLPLIQHIERFPGLKRVPIYKLMEDYQWKEDTLFVFLQLFNATSFETHLPMVDFLNSLSPMNLHHLVKVSRDEGHYLIQIARHLPAFELQVMADNLLSLSSVQDMLQYLHYLEAHRKTSKHCSLCRQKRMYNMQYRLCEKQIPKDTLTIPGMLPLYDRAEVWAADDERHYQFETSGMHAGQIFWQKMPVNLVEICDNCLSEVHKAITNQGRHDSIYHLSAAERKTAMRIARDNEQDLALIVMQVSKERKLRRLREFGLSALHLQGLGLQKEAEKRAADEYEAKKQAERHRADEERRILNEKTLSVDEKWKQIDHRHDMEYLDYRNRFALVQLHRGFDGTTHPVPKNRKHATTWQRDDYDEDGLPITAEAANKMFGMAVEVDHSHEKPLINIWKKIADEKHALFKERERLKEEEKRRIALENFQTLKDYIQERLTVLDRQQEQMKAIQEEEEIRRQQGRVFDKQERRRLRFEAYLQQERYHMEVEDARSHAHRAHIEEILREDNERENMYNAECDQRELDRFWGLDYYEQLLREEEKRLRAFYQARIIQLNQEMQKMGCVQARRKKGDREKLIVPVEVRPVGSLPEEKSFLIQAADKARQLYMIKKLKAEEIRCQLKYRLKFSYS